MPVKALIYSDRLQGISALCGVLRIKDEGWLLRRGLAFFFCEHGQTGPVCTKKESRGRMKGVPDDFKKGIL